MWVWVCNSSSANSSFVAGKPLIKLQALAISQGMYTNDLAGIIHGRKPGQDIVSKERMM